MKKLLVALFALLLCCTVALAHPGGTDAAGGHYDRSTGEYHYHHGHKAHQHYNGQCPYSFDDRTGADSRPSDGGGSGSVEMPVLRNDSDTAEPVKASTSTWDDLVSLVTSAKFWIGIAEIIVALAIPVAIYEWAMHSRKKQAKVETPKEIAVPTPSPKAPQRRPHRLDLLDQFEVVYGDRLVKLYSLPAARISHVGYLRDTQQLFIRFRSDNGVLVYRGVPISMCSELVRSSLPDQYYDILISQHFPVERIL